MKAMRKTVIAIAMVLGVVANANNFEKIPARLATYKVVKVTYRNVNPFCLSVFNNDLETVKKLIHLGADVNEFSSNKTPLMYAARYNRVEMIKLLVANGADLSIKDQYGNDALKYAELSDAKEAAALIKELLAETAR